LLKPSLAGQTRTEILALSLRLCVKLQVFVNLHKCLRLYENGKLNKSQNKLNTRQNALWRV